MRVAVNLCSSIIFSSRVKYLPTASLSKPLALATEVASGCRRLISGCRNMNLLYHVLPAIFDTLLKPCGMSFFSATSYASFISSFRVTPKNMFSMATRCFTNSSSTCKGRTCCLPSFLISPFACLLLPSKCLFRVALRFCVRVQAHVSIYV